MAEIATKSPSTGGRACAVVLAGFAVYGMTFGMCCSLGVYATAFLETFQTTRRYATGAAASSLTFIALSGLLSGWLQHRLGSRPTVMMGSCVASLGLFCSYFVQDVAQLIVTCAITGVGFGLTVVPSLAIQTDYFTEYRNLAVGFVPVGSPVGLFIFPILFTFLIEQYSWRGSMLINSAIAFHCVAAGALMKPHLPWEKLKDAKLVLLCINWFCWNGCTTVYYSFFSSLATNHGLTVVESAWAMSVCGMCDLVGRVGTAALNHFHTNCLLLYLVSTLLFGAATILCAYCYSFWAFVLTAGVFGMGFGSMISTLGVVIVTFFGKEDFSFGFGCGSLVGGVGSLTIASVSGYLSDSVSPELAMSFPGALNLAGILCFYIGFRLIIRSKGRSHIENCEHFFELATLTED